MIKDKIITNTFQSLGLDNFLVDVCKSLGMDYPTPIQAKTIPIILKGDDIIGRAKTGSGKTAAFALPVINKLSKDPYGIFCLILTPTRELAFQLDHQFLALGKCINISTCVISGGTNKIQEMSQLEKRPNIVIATPGRLSNHITNGTTLHLKYLKFLILDEADRLLEPCFEKSLKTILDILPNKKFRQTLLFSATITSNIKKLNSLCNNKIKIFEATSDSIYSVVDQLNSYYLFIPRLLKECYLISLITKHFLNKTIIIFVSTKNTCEVISELLTELNIQCVSLHSNINQSRRLASLGKFKSKKVKILISTDVGSRGLDIPLIDVVINFDVPRKIIDYIHRVGRTARIGCKGKAITLVSQYEIELFKSVEKLLNKKIDEFTDIESEEEITKTLKKIMNAKRLAQINIEDYRKKRRKYSGL